MLDRRSFLARLLVAVPLGSAAVWGVLRGADPAQVAGRPEDPLEEIVAVAGTESGPATQFFFAAFVFSPNGGWVRIRQDGEEVASHYVDAGPGWQPVRISAPCRTGMPFTVDVSDVYDQQ